MKARTFTIGQGHRFSYDPSGGLTALPGDDGNVRVIGGQLDLRGSVGLPDEWSDVDEATGNNAQISDGEELYAGAGFGDPLIEGQLEDILWALRRHVGRPTGRLLEVGCGPGFLLERLRKELPGWQLVGLDPAPASVEQALARGITCHQGFLHTVDLQTNFDAIVVMGNLQLHPDLGDTLRRLYELAVPGATLFVDSKNPRSCTRRIASRLVEVPALGQSAIVQGLAAHAFHGLRRCPTQGQLVDLMSQAGWTVRKVRTVAPRLLRYGNTHEFGRGMKSAVWRAMDQLDKTVDERAWIQVGAEREH